MDNITSWTNNQLEDLLRQLGLALEVSGIGIWQHNITRNQTRWDDQLKGIYGVPKGPLDVVWLDSVHRDDVALTNEIFLEAITAKSDYAAEFRIIRPDGEIRYLRSRARYFIDHEGEPCFIGAEWDVTDDVLRNQQLAAERETAERSRADARFAADHDYLTGLLNRRSFDAVLASQSENQDAEVALCHIDVDRFKEVNDRFGHSGGDLVLTHLSKVLADSISAGDYAARLGGDEFAILLIEAGAERVGTVVDNIRKELAAPVRIKRHSVHIECSIGIATAGASEIDALLSRSDIALYQAKKDGRNRTEVFSEGLASDFAEERQLVADLRAGLQQGEIVPHYQIQVDAKSHAINGLEALARWNHPTKGLLPPGKFLDLASENGLLEHVDEAILAAVLNDIGRWAAAGINVPRVSVNLSAGRLSDPALIEKLTRFNIPPGMLSFELIETIFLDTLAPQIKDNIAGIRSLGIDIEIDDLGSGHASLVGLVELRPDRVKIDRHLISPILQSVAQRRLVRSLVDIAKALDTQVVAEGVETLEHAAVLEKLGVQALQGFALGRPEPADQIELRLVRRNARRKTDT